MTMVWDDRLISRERAYAVAGEWPVMFHEEDGRRFWRCDRCAQAVTEIRPLRLVTLDGLVAAMVRHAVTAHNVNLSGSGDGRGDSDSPAAADGSCDYVRPSAAAAADRREPEESRGGGIAGAAGGGER